jgi:hypothetical protein
MMLLFLATQAACAGPKLNAEGQYQPFPGITVVAPVDHETKARLKPFFEGLAESVTVKRYCAPLPLESAHMTTLNLFTQGKKSSEEWSQFLKEKKPLLKKLRAHLQKHAFRPTGKVKTLSFFSTGQFVLDLSPEQDEKLRAVAKRFQLEQTLPGKWHVTFCYFYKEVPMADTLAFREELERITTKALGSMQPRMTFEAPSIHTFQDMESYEPWKTKSFKWLSSMKNFFSKHQDPTPTAPAQPDLSAPPSTMPQETSPPALQDPAHAPDLAKPIPLKPVSEGSTSAASTDLHAIRE